MLWIPKFLHSETVHFQIYLSFEVYFWTQNVCECCYSFKYVGCLYLFSLLLFVWFTIEVERRVGMYTARDAQKNPWSQTKVFSFVHTSSMCLFFFTSWVLHCVNCFYTIGLFNIGCFWFWFLVDWIFVFVFLLLLKLKWFLEPSTLYYLWITLW